MRKRKPVKHRRRRHHFERPCTEAPVTVVETNNSDALVEQEADQLSDTFQGSFEQIIIRGSENVTVRTTDTQAAVNLQVALQLAIALILSVSLADSQEAEGISQDLFQRVQVTEVNQQKTLILNSRDVRVTTTDTDVTANIQILLQVLLALVAKLDIL